MKKLLYLTAALAFFCACEQAEDFEQPVQGGATSGEISEVIYASVADNDSVGDMTRTAIDGYKVVYWNPGDAIAYIGPKAHRAKYQYEGDKPVLTAEFVQAETDDIVPEGAIMPSVPYAVSPYSSEAHCKSVNGVDVLSVNFPAEQTYAASSFGRDANVMVAVGKDSDDTDFYFRNACGYLVIKLCGGMTVKSITLTALGGEKIAGKGYITASQDAAPVVTMTDEGSSSITLNCPGGVDVKYDEKAAVWFMFAMPPTTFSKGLKIAVTNSHGDVFIKETSKVIDITRNEIQPMAVLRFEPTVPTTTKLWYTRADDVTAPIEFYDYEDNPNPFDATITDHYYEPTRKHFVIEFDSPLTTIKASAFRGTNLATIQMPESVTTIEKEAFRGTPLTEILLSGNVNTIGVDAFYGCEQLTSVTFKSSLTKTPLKIGYTISASDADGPFYDSPLTTINLNRTLVVTDDNGEAFTPDDWGEGLFANKHYDEEAYLNQGVTVTLGEQVTTLSDYMFNWLPIQTLTIPGTVTTIGDNVFNGCTKLTSLTFEPSPTGEALTLGYNTEGEEDGPFLDSPLEQVYLGRELIYTLASKDLDADDEGVFSGRTTLTNVTLGEQVRTLSDYMFSNSGITSLTIPGTVTTIGVNAFYGCEQLASVTFEPSVDNTPLNIGYSISGSDADGPFYYSPLTTINLNRTLVVTDGNGNADTPDDWGEGLFANKHYDEEDYLNQGVSVTLGEQVTTLSDYMFNRLPIQSLTIPATVTAIGRDVFDGCSKLASLTFEACETPLEIKGQNDSDGPFYDSPLSTIDYNRNFVYKKNNGEEYVPGDNTDGIFAISSDAKEVAVASAVQSTVRIGSLIQAIPERMFCNLPITALTIPATVTTIGNNVFNGCTELATLTIDHSATNLTLGYNTDDTEGPFYESALTTLTLNRQIDYPFTGKQPADVDEGAFATDGGTLTNVTLGDQVTTLSAYMFAKAGKSTVDYLNKVTTIEEGVFCNSQIESITIPNTVETIGMDVFYGCGSLNTVNIMDGTSNLTIVCQSRGFARLHGPFYNSPLANVHIGREIWYTNGYGSTISTNYWEGGFLATEECDAVDEVTVTLSNHVKKIYNYMFTKLKLKSITIPASVTYIGSGAFMDCDDLNTIVFEDGDTPLRVTSQYVVSTVTFWGPFYDSPLTSITLGREIEYYKGDGSVPDEENDGLFASEDNVESLSVTLTDKVKTISPYMFAGRPIQQITIPASVTSIGNNAFDDCTSLSSITFEDGNQPLHIGFQDQISDKGPFYDSPLTNIALYRELVYDYDNLDATDEGIFSNSKKLPTKVSLGGGLRTILPYMFSETGVGAVLLSNGQYTAGSVWIPHTIESIGDKAFYDCDRLAGLTLGYDGTINLPTIGTGVFDECEKFSYIKVRKKQLQKFKDSSVWDAYESKFTTSNDFE